MSRCGLAPRAQFIRFGPRISSFEHRTPGWAPEGVSGFISPVFMSLQSHKITITPVTNCYLMRYSSATRAVFGVVLCFIQFLSKTRLPNQCYITWVKNLSAVFTYVNLILSMYLLHLSQVTQLIKSRLIQCIRIGSLLQLVVSCPVMNNYGKQTIALLKACLLRDGHTFLHYGFTSLRYVNVKQVLKNLVKKNFKRHCWKQKKYT